LRFFEKEKQTMQFPGLPRGFESIEYVKSVLKTLKKY